MNENMEVKIQGDLPHFENVKEIKKCPRCQSVYLTDKECEACGFQLNFNFIGKPFGHMCFYDIQENFYRMGSLRKLVYFIVDKKYSRYLKYELAIKRRLDNLLQYFFDHIDPVEANRKYFYLELTHLVAEFEKLGLKKYLSQKIKDKLGVKISVASQEELKSQTGCEPYCAIPFGYPKEITILIDPEIYNQQKFIFSPGPTEKTIEIAGKDVEIIFSALPNNKIRL